MKLTELAMKGVSVAAKAAAFAAENASAWKTGEHIGDIEKLQVRRTGNYISLWGGDELISYFSLEGDTVDNIWVDPAHRGKRVFSKLLWFLRSRENLKRIVIGDYHSPETQEIVKGGLKQFKKSWWNKDTLEIADFSPATVDKFYKVPYVDWALVLENEMKAFDSWPRFDGNGFVKESYDWINWEPDPE